MPGRVVPRQRECRPEVGAASQVAGGPGTSLARNLAVRAALPLHPLDSPDPVILDAYLVGRHDEREYGQSAAYARGRRDEAEAMAEVQRHAAGIVEAASRWPVPLSRDQRMARSRAAAERIAAELDELRGSAGRWSA